MHLMAERLNQAAQLLARDFNIVSHQNPQSGQRAHGALHESGFIEGLKGSLLSSLTSRSHCCDNSKGNHDCNSPHHIQGRPI
jgi:hypothetical protein